MAIVISIVAFFFIILQTVVSGVMPQEMVDVLIPAPDSSIKTSSGVVGSLQCTKNSHETYAVCASESNTAVKYNLQPLSFAAKGPDQGNYMNSCDLYEKDSQSTSRAVCVKGSLGKGVVYFHRVSDMTSVTNVAIGVSGRNTHVIVDTLNQIAYVSNDIPDSHREIALLTSGINSKAFYKITNIGSSTPTIVATLSYFGSGDSRPSAMLIVDRFLYLHFSMDPARLARIHIASFTWSQTVPFASGESYGNYDNLANDENYIYDLTAFGILVRCTYNNYNFLRFDSLNTGLSITYSLAISPDQRSLFVVSFSSGVLQMVDVASFSMFGNAVSVPSAWGRPIVTSRHVYAFSEKIDLVYPFQYPNRAAKKGSESTVPVVAPVLLPSEPNLGVSSLLGKFTEMLDFKILIISTVTTILLLFYGSARNSINQLQQKLEKERNRADLTGTQLASLTIQVLQKDGELRHEKQERDKEKKRADLAGTQLQQKDQELQQKDQELQQKDAEIERLCQLLNPSPFVKDKLYQIDFAANGITPPADPSAFGTLLTLPSQNNSLLYRYVRDELWKKLGTMIPTPKGVYDFTLESIEVIYSDVTTLEGRMRRLQLLRTQNGAFFNPPTGAFTAEQLQTLIALRDQFLPRPSNVDQKSPNLINVFHGTKIDLLHSVVNGLVAVRTTDAGYFGSGVYTTTSIEYAAKYAKGDFDLNNGPYPPRASDGCFPVVWCVAAVGVCYPLTREVDYSRNRIHGGMTVSDFFGMPLNREYDCHCVAVNESVGFQAVPRRNMQYMEVVFDQEVQVLPIAVLWVKPI